jgi:hypothetical protein
MCSMQIVECVWDFLYGNWQNLNTKTFTLFRVLKKCWYLHDIYISVLVYMYVWFFIMWNNFKLFKVLILCTNSISIQIDHNRSCIDQINLIKIIDQTPQRVWSISVRLAKLINRLVFENWSISDRWSIWSINQDGYTIKPANVVTSIKQLLVLKGHLFLVLS